ncbi:hypothetical protein G6F70_004306 [Rhizopus microsporus]|uniref:Uncharacterized protein n=2 Tax=Rhizopus TaxID=4842 RepID=A0A367JVZ0_RHIAZ|nr:hypothetical protein G6F71_004316 [Rhizopus microsporus]RCH94103.1 hypothetical protein CU097_007183 [Rhizopus azygosporus]KAG1200125.1 hypothetical protein G6F70_004306 [Rhizopus microsporus]KAG1211795.1 hypothetical protein G6F69_004272 [Rhizopus microsporus]KAG1233777.1 hypothetical protein G6F67_004020 [Rhizopus microsporus]
MYNITSFDLHLLTFDTTPNVKRTIKSWFNLTQPNLTVHVTDNWFPSSLPYGSANKTWTFFAFLLDHDSSIDPTNISVDQTFVEFKVVQSTPQPVTIDYKPLEPWVVALIVVSCVLAVSAMGIAVWWWKRRMEKKAVLSRPDAMLIADKFREVMSTSDLAQRNKKNAQDLLQRQLQAEEGTSIIEIRQSSSTINK